MGRQQKVASKKVAKKVVETKPTVAKAVEPAKDTTPKSREGYSTKEFITNLISEKGISDKVTIEDKENGMLSVKRAKGIRLFNCKDSRNGSYVKFRTEKYLGCLTEGSKKKVKSSLNKERGYHIYTVVLEKDEIKSFVEKVLNLDIEGNVRLEGRKFKQEQ